MPSARIPTKRLISRSPNNPVDSDTGMDCPKTPDRRILGKGLADQRQSHSTLLLLSRIHQSVKF